MRISFVAVSVVQIAGAATQDVVSTGRTVTLDEIAYHVPPHPVGAVTGNIPVPGTDFGLLPLTFVNTNASGFDSQSLSVLKDEFLQSDDVIQRAFLNGKHETISYFLRISNNKQSRSSSK